MISDVIIARRARSAAIFPYQLELSTKRKNGAPIMVEPHPMGGWRLKIDPFLLWTRDTLGYAPTLAPGAAYRACFRDQTDAELFRLAFIEYWM